MANLVKEMKYQELTKHILSKIPDRYRRNFYSWIEDGYLINQGKNITEKGIEIAHLEYTAILFFDEFPYRELSATYLMAIIQLWLNENDELRDIQDEYKIKIDLDILDEKIADLTFSIQFLEPITAIEDNSGNLEIEGKKYRLNEIEITLVNDIDIAMN